MAHKFGFISYTLATVASLCFVGGLLVLSGGEHEHGNVRDYRISAR